MFNLMNFESFIYVCNHHPQIDNTFNVPRKFPYDLSQSIPTASPCWSIYFIGEVYDFHHIDMSQFIYPFFYYCVLLPVWGHYE